MLMTSYHQESLSTDVYSEVPDGLRRHFDEDITETGSLDPDGHFPL